MDDDGSSILGFPRSAGQERLSGIIIPFILLNFFSQHLSLSFIHQTNNVLFYHNPFAYPTCTDTLVFYLSSAPETSHGKQLEKMNLQSYWTVSLVTELNRRNGTLLIGLGHGHGTMIMMMMDRIFPIRPAAVLYRDIVVKWMVGKPARNRRPRHKRVTGELW